MNTEEARRALYINARSLILKALDILDKAYQVGKYKPGRSLASSPTETVSGIMETSPRVNTSAEQNQI